MLSLSRQFRPHRRIPRSLRLRGGFTLVEIVIALAVLGVMAAGCYIGFNAINEYSVSSRLYTEAQTVCQNQIDLILSKEPFDVTSVDPVTSQKNKIPEVLKLNSERTPNGPLVQDNVFIYQDPVSGKVIVTGSMTTTVSDIVSTMTFAGTTANLNIRTATVEVKYRFRNRDYTVAMDTIRTADQ
jgi:prepilin-type N-terminal cleavage/methylation domain-containing protein